MTAAFTTAGLALKQRRETGRARLKINFEPDGYPHKQSPVCFCLNVANIGTQPVELTSLWVRAQKPHKAIFSVRFETKTAFPYSLQPGVMITFFIPYEPFLRTVQCGRGWRRTFQFLFFDRVGNQYVYDSKVSYKDLLRLLEWMDYRVKQELLLLLHFSAP